jgi:hypothetical protein
VSLTEESDWNKIGKGARRLMQARRTTQDPRSPQYDRETKQENKLTRRKRREEDWERRKKKDEGKAKSVVTNGLVTLRRYNKTKVSK